MRLDDPKLERIGDTNSLLGKQEIDGEVPVLVYPPENLEIEYIKIGKNKVTAKKEKGRVLLGTDGNYYLSKKNKKGVYVWILIEKK